MTTTITDSQIRQLHREAAQAGDHAQVAVCLVALLAPLSEIQDAYALVGTVPAHLRSLTPTAARVECARVITEAHA